MFRALCLLVCASVLLVSIPVWAAEPPPASVEKKSLSAEPDKNQKVVAAADAHPAGGIAKEVKPAGSPSSKPAIPKASEETAAKVAKKRFQRIQQTQVELDRAFLDLRERLDKYVPGDLTSEKATIISLKTVLSKLRVGARELKEAEADFEQAVDEHRTELRKAPDAYRNLSAHFNKIAEAEDLQELKIEYRKLAQRALQDAGYYERREADLGVAAAKVKATLVFIRRANKLLERLHAYLEIAPDPSKAAEIDTFVRAAEKWVGQFRQALQSFGEWNDRRQGAPSPVPQQSPPLPGVPQQSQRPVAPSRQQRRSASTGGTEENSIGNPNLRKVVSRVTLLAPEDARIWVNGVEAPVREFFTPPLTVGQGQRYFYRVELELVRDGHKRSEIRRALITPGEPVEIDFNTELVASR